MVAAITAADAGKSVIILESQAMGGGNSVRSTGGMNAAKTVYQDDNDFDEAAGTLAVRRTIHMEKGGRLVAGATKTGRGTRNILLPASTAQLLSERKKHSWSEWIFPNPLKPESPTNPRSAYGHLKALLDSAGLPNIRFHDLRHTFATHALSSGVDAKTLSGILGHTKASFTLDTYTHVTGDMQQRAADIVGGFMTDFFGEELKPWQNAENGAPEAST